jgi:hypothetical protein
LCTGVRFGTAEDTAAKANAERISLADI